MSAMNGTMRDGSVDQDTGWISDGMWERKAPRLETGYAGLGGDPETAKDRAKVIDRAGRVGRRQILLALKDPEAKPLVLKILDSANPEDALARQAEQDVAEFANPTGKVIVFKDLARKLGNGIRNAQNRMIDAVQNPHSQDGKIFRGILAASPTPKEDIESHFFEIGVQELLPDEFGDIAGLGALGITKKMRRLIKYAAIGTAAAVGVALIPGALPAIGSAITAVGGVVGGAVKSIFTPKAAAPPAGEAVSTGVDQGYVNGELQAICSLMQSAAFDISAGSQADAKKAALAQYLSRGQNIPAAQALTAIESATAQCKMSGGSASQYTAPAAAAPAAPPGPDLSQLANAALAIYKLKMTGDTAAAAQQQQQVASQLVAQGMSPSAAQALVDQAVQQVAASAPAPEPVVTALPHPTPRPVQASMGIETGDLVKYGLMAAIALAAFSQMGKGGGGRRRSRSRSRRR